MAKLIGISGLGTTGTDIDQAKSAMLSINDAEDCFRNRLTDLGACFKEKATANERTRFVTLVAVGVGAFLLGRYVTRLRA